MFGKNIRFYRLLSGLSQEELAERVGLQTSIINDYESNIIMPNANTLKKICASLNISMISLLNYQNGPIYISGGCFRKSDSLSPIQKEAVISQIECEINRYALIADAVISQIECEINRYALIADIVNFEFECQLPEKTVAPYLNAEDSAKYMRTSLGLPLSGPINNLLQVIESAGIFVVPLDMVPFDFSGYAYRDKKGLSIIAINGKMTAERQRFSMAHELTHLFFDTENKYPEKDIDKIAGCFLLPELDVIKELKLKEGNVEVSELHSLHDNYGICGNCVALRALQTHIISVEEYNKYASIRFSTKAKLETPTRFQQLVYRAYFEGKIGIGKVAEMLKIPISDARDTCNVRVSAEW